MDGVREASPRAPGARAAGLRAQSCKLGFSLRLFTCPPYDLNLVVRSELSKFLFRSSLKVALHHCEPRGLGLSLTWI